MLGIVDSGEDKSAMVVFNFVGICKPIRWGWILKGVSDTRDGGEVVICRMDEVCGWSGV